MSGNIFDKNTGIETRLPLIKISNALIIILFCVGCLAAFLIKIPLYYFIISIICFYIPILVLFILLTVKIRNNLRNSYLKNITSSQIIYRNLMDVVQSFYNAGNMQNKNNNDKPVQINNSINEKLRLIDSIMEELNNFENYFKRPLKQISVSFEKKIDELTTVSEELRNEVLQYLDNVLKMYSVKKESDDINENNITTIIFYTGLSIPILYDLTGMFNEFSKDVILELINKFEDISVSSHKIADEIEASMTSLMNIEIENSLAFILKKAKNLAQDFENFYKNMEDLKNSSENYTNKSTEKLKNIQSISYSIEDIAETIRVLSLNVSIEAVNVGEFGKGFQVLAKDLREFTAKTMKFANEVNIRVKDALNTTDKLKSDYVQSMDKVYGYIENIKTSISSFEGIIKISFDRIEEIILDIKKFAEYIDSGIKEVIWKLQYYDITSQEIDHLKLFIEKVFYKVIEMKGVDVNKIETMREDEKSQIKRNILTILSGIITTADERKVLEKYEVEFGIKMKKDIKIENKASQDIKDDEDSIIIF